MPDVRLHWPKYRLLPYEKKLALEEVQSLLNPKSIQPCDDTISITTSARSDKLRELTYFESFEIASGRYPTVQRQMENGSNGSAKRQATRYSAHGLHEYKGKFNPQVARSLLNIALGRRHGSVLDPFCGSGTTLIEAAQLGHTAIGFDINPLAVMIANAKISALRVCPEMLFAFAEKVIRRKLPYRGDDDDRTEYLRSWFDTEQLTRIERLRTGIEETPEPYREILLVVASNLLREFSLQDPADLRIRRRAAVTSIRDVCTTFVDDVAKLSSRLADAQSVRRIAARHGSKAFRCDTRENGISAAVNVRRFDVAISSPPYAMALPYIDTQRLSLVWLSLISPAEIASLQGSLVGSREFATTTKKHWLARLMRNADELPGDLSEFCQTLQRAVGPQDGFRRQAVPALLYRYLVEMRDTMRTVASLLKPGGVFLLIVGHNHTTLSGKRIDINTPSLLERVAADAGLDPGERVTLDTYQRFGLHQRNAIVNEELMTLVRPR